MTWRSIRSLHKGWIPIAVATFDDHRKKSYKKFNYLWCVKDGFLLALLESNGVIFHFWVELHRKCVHRTANVISCRNYNDTAVCRSKVHIFLNNFHILYMELFQGGAWNWRTKLVQAIPLGICWDRAVPVGVKGCCVYKKTKDPQQLLNWCRIK